ncbi:DUF488 domain-containing protein [Ramlibacter sp. G-1-2-2]|uniref:DUF488 domain-containing protein n=1 Tax=Ramlibacter agri TaxID=2728837 RepID=A0A848H3Q8_9BURK|nr:DUF488 domain-containing protein [Ramlibacter agri]NML44149.1 DUF488 domain-containing protein [Ramlibacter agri]
MRIWTVGHSTRSADAFLALLRGYGIEAIADVRRFPGSRRHPQFGADALAASLHANGLAYHWIPRLGGRRRPALPPEEWGWRNASFQGYAEYLRTEEFAEGLDVLLNMGEACPTAMMCSELLWWRCHRSLVADVLVFSGFEVTHIVNERESKPHPYTSPARVADGQLLYPPPVIPP